MANEYLKHSNLARYNVRFLFQPGDKVLLRKQEAGKLATKAHGPFIFVIYAVPLGVTAKIQSADGTKQIVSHMCTTNYGVTWSRETTAIALGTAT